MLNDATGEGVMTIYRVLSMSMVTSFEKIEVFSENLREMQYNIESIQDFLTMKELPEPSVRANISSYDYWICVSVDEPTSGLDNILGLRKSALMKLMKIL